MAQQHDRWRQHDSNRDDYQRRDRSRDRDDQRSRSHEARQTGGYRPGQGAYRSADTREDRGGVPRYEFENDAYGQGYWPAGYDDDRDLYGSDEYYGREDESHPYRYTQRESGQFRGVSRWRPRDPLHESRADWVREAGPTGPRWTGQYAPEQYRGPHRGKGPRGYRRSDDRLKEIVSERLMDDPQIDASDITLDVNGQIVTLTGTVDDRYIKHLVEDLVENCGAEDVINNLRVRRAGQGTAHESEALAKSTSQPGQTQGRAGSKAGNKKTSRGDY